MEFDKMASVIYKILVFVIALSSLSSAVPQYQRQIQPQYQQRYQPQQQQQVEPVAVNLLDIETPTSFTYDSPLRQPDSLRSRPYFDFLSTLYRRDSDKSALFRPYTRAARDTDASSQKLVRRRRAIVFRPLFTYKQQQIKKEKARRRRV